MKIHQTVLLGIAAAVTLAAGCATQGPTRIQPGGPTAVTTMGVDLADFRNAAGEMVREMLASPSLTGFAQANQRRPAICVGDIRNKSDVMIDLDQLAGRINEDLLNSGLVEIIATDAGVVDAVKQQQQQAADGRPLTVLHTADYLLEGAIMMLSGREGRIREKSYTFQLKLNNTRTQRVAWQKTVDVSKQTTKPAVSW